MTVKIIMTFFLLTSLGIAHASNSKMTAHKVAGALEKLDLKNLPVWSKDNYRKYYTEIRDKKILEYKGQKRRIPWLYSRDGCHMRSTYFTREAEKLGYEVPKKIFIFGSLEIKGNMIPRGSVEPWFHAAPIVQVDGEAFVLDPSVSFSRPLKLGTWISRIVKDKKKVIYSICDSETYLPTSNCLKPAPLNESRLEEEAELFLKFETNIMRNLGLSFN